MRTALAIVALAAGPLVAQNWNNLAPANTPGSLTSSTGILIDEGQLAEVFAGPLVTYGGTVFPAVGFSDETFTFDGVDWALASPAKPASLGERWSHVMAYDPATGGVMLYGGVDGTLFAATGTFEYDTVQNTWTEVEAGLMPGVTSPTASALCSTCRTVGGVLVFGGMTGLLGSPFDETWEWNGTAWTNLAPATTPPARIGAFMAYDAARGVVVMFGGSDGSSDLADTWEFDGIDWTRVMTDNSPTARGSQGGGMAFDLVRLRCVLRGGTAGNPSAQRNDLWEYDGSDWYEVTTASLPPTGVATTLEFHTLSGAMIAVGFSLGTTVDETWSYGGAGAIFETFGVACPNTMGAPVLTAPGGSVPVLGGAFVVEVSHVPENLALAILTFASGNRLDLTPIGMPGCFGYADVFGPAPFVFAGIGNPAPLNLFFPANPAFAGLAFYLQAAVPDSSLGTALQISASNGARLVLN